MKTKKGQAGLGNNLLVTTILTVFIVGFIGVLSANMNSELGADFAAGSLEANITTQSNQGIENVTEKLDLVGLVGVMIFLLGLVLLVVRQFA